MSIVMFQWRERRGKKMGRGGGCVSTFLFRCIFGGREEDLMGFYTLSNPLCSIP